MHAPYPYHLDRRGRTASPSDATYIRGLIEQILFTSPGERLNRPEFGSGLRRLLFSPNSNLVAETIQVTVQAGLQQWLGDLIQVGGVEATSDDSTLQVVVHYTVRDTGESQSQTFTRTETPAN